MASIFKRGGRYYVQYFDHTGKRRVVSARTTDKATAERIAGKLEADAALEREGVVDARLKGICDESRRTVESHLTDYEAKMKAANRTAQHIASTIGYIRVIAEAEGFTRWLAVDDKLVCDPFVSVKKPNPKADRRRERRFLLPDEFHWLRSILLADGADWRGIPADERLLLYVTAIQTGLRSVELRALTRARLFLDVEIHSSRARLGQRRTALTPVSTSSRIWPRPCERTSPSRHGRPRSLPCLALPKWRTCCGRTSPVPGESGSEWPCMTRVSTPRGSRTTSWRT